MKSLADVIHEKVETAFGYLNEFRLNSVSDDDKKKYDVIEEAFAGMDLLYCELQGDVEEDSDDIRTLAEPHLDGEEFNDNIVEIVEALCHGLAVYKRAFEILNETEYPVDKCRIHEAINKAEEEIKQEEEEDA